MAFPDLWGSNGAISNTHAGSRENIASTAVLRDGWVVTAWKDLTNYSLKGQILKADGSTFGIPFEISAPGVKIVGAPSIAALPDGRFMVVYVRAEPYQRYTIVQETYDVFGGRIDSNPIDSVVGALGLDFVPPISAFSDGSFYITYTDGDGSGIDYFRYADEVATRGAIDSSIGSISIGRTAASQTHFAVSTPQAGS